MSDFVTSPMPPEITRRTRTPLVGCTVSAGSEKLCFTSKRSIDSSGRVGIVSYRYVGMIHTIGIRPQSASPQHTAKPHGFTRSRGGAVDYSAAPRLRAVGRALVCFL